MKTEPGPLMIFSRALLFCMLSTLAQQSSASNDARDETQSRQVKLSEAQPDELKLSFEQWDLARHGEQLIKIPALKTMVNEWSSKTDYVIELRYPGGEEGELWVRELMDWLISLGIPSQYLVSVPGSGEADVIKFQIIKSEERYR